MEEVRRRKVAGENQCRSGRHRNKKIMYTTGQPSWEFSENIDKWVGSWKTIKELRGKKEDDQKITAE